MKKPLALRNALRIGLSSYVTNGMSAAAGLLLISALVAWWLGPLAAASATVGVIVVTPPDQPAPQRGKFTHLLPAALISVPLFFAVQALRDAPLWLWVLLVGATFVAFLGAAWGKRGLPISIAAMLAVVFSLAAAPQEGSAATHVHSLLETTWHFALGAALYLVFGTAANAALNGRYRALVLVDAMFAVADLMRTQARQFVPGHATEKETSALLTRLIGAQAALADQLQTARNIVLESPRTLRRQQLAGMLMLLLDMRDHLVACALDLDTVKADPAQARSLEVLAAELQMLAVEVETVADALLLARRAPPFERQRHLEVFEAGAHDAASAVTSDGPPVDMLARGLANRVGYLHAEVQRLVGLARGEHEPDLAVVRAAWQMFVSPTAWSWRPIRGVWRWDAPPLRHAIRAALAIGAGQALSVALPWGTHDYWILLTIVVVLRGSLAQTLERRNARVAGTLMGCVLAGLLLYASVPAAALLLVVTFAQGVAHAFAIRRYLVTAVAATVLALVQAHLLNAELAPVFEVAERVADTLIGVALAWLFSYVLPSWERTQIPALVERTLAAQARHAQLALGLGQLREVGNDAEIGWRLARREVYDSLSALVMATQRAMSEPRAVQPPLASLERMIAHSYQLLAQLTAAKTMLLQRRDRLRVEQVAAPLQHAAQAIAAVLEGRTGAVPQPASQLEAPAMMDLPDPFEQDLSPWLLRRLQLAERLSHELRMEAARSMA